jgi:hypothetical protein
MLEILDNDEENNLNDADSPKSPPPSSHNLRSPRKLRSTQTAQATTSDIDTNERLPIQVPLANKWYTPKAGAWENMKEARQRIYTHVQNIEGSSGMLRDPLCALCVKQGYECRVYKQNSGPHFGGACSRCRLSGRSCEKVCANSILLFYQLTRI